MKIFKVFLCLLICFSLLFTVGCGKTYVNYEVDNSNNLRVHFIDVGQGDSIFIETPGKETILIDSGEATYSNTVCDYIRKLGYDSITHIVGTHPHTDHIGGLADIITAFNVSNVYLPKVSSNTATFEKLLLTIKSKGLKVITAKSGLEIINTGNLKAEIISPKNDYYSEINNYSVVIILKYGKTKFLFTGDAETDIENEITSDVSCNVLKVSHHGSNTSSSVEFLERVKPEYAVISCGKDNSYGHPHKEIMERLSEIGAKTVRTDQSGTLVFESDGENITVSDNAQIILPNEKEAADNGGKYVLNTSSMKIHYPDCSSVKSMKAENIAVSNKTINTLKAEGYEPCGRCKPE